MTLALPRHLSMAELEAALDTIRQSPKDHGVLELIGGGEGRRARACSRKASSIPSPVLSETPGRRAASRRSADGGPHPEMQLNIMNARVVALVAQDKTRWPLAGDQLFVDMDLSEANLPAGTRLQIGTSVIEVTAEPHTGCGKFVERSASTPRTSSTPSSGRISLCAHQAKSARAPSASATALQKFRSRCAAPQ